MTLITKSVSYGSCGDGIGRSSNQEFAKVFKVRTRRAGRLSHLNSNICNNKIRQLIDPNVLMLTTYSIHFQIR
jgi:hypothetical protein